MEAPTSAGPGPSSGTNNTNTNTSSAVVSCADPAAAAPEASREDIHVGAEISAGNDERIAQLQNDLVTTEREFVREMFKVNQERSEEVLFWRAKSAQQEEQVAQMDAALQRLRAELDTRDEEVRRLRQQVRGLKEWVSTSTRAGDMGDGGGSGGSGGMGIGMGSGIVSGSNGNSSGSVGGSFPGVGFSLSGQAVSDDVFSDGMARLANGLQNWVIVHFRRAKMVDVPDSPDNPGDPDGPHGFDDLARLVPTHADLRHTARLPLLQSVIARLLVELVFSPYFVGLPADQAAQLAQAEALLLSFAGSAEPVNRWRALTLAVVSRDATQQLQAETVRVADYVVARINGVLDVVTDVQSTDARDQALRSLVVSAIDLARLLVAQRAIFRVFMPEILSHQQVLFDPETMEDMGGEDDDGLAHRDIACVTFPGVIKRGDETGSHLQYRNVIFKARVICAPE